MINIYDSHGKWHGTLLGSGGVPIVLHGLWGMVTHYKSRNELFAVSGPNNQTAGYVVSLSVDQLL